MELRTTMGTMSGNPAQDVKTMYNYVFQLTEELRYLLNNLGVTNFNDLELARYENGRLQIYSEALELRAKRLEVSFSQADGELETKINATVSGLKTEVTELGNQVTGLGNRTSTLEQTASQIKTTVSEQGTTIGDLQSSITQNAGKISAIVSAVGSGGTVSAASIVAAINSAGSNVQISADHITLTGYVTAEDLEGEGRTTVNGANITTGEINAVNFVASGDLDGDVSRSFVVVDEAGTVIGNIGYQYVSSDGFLGDKLWIRTLSNKDYLPAIKIQASGNVSIQSEHELVYIRSEDTVTISAPSRIYIYAADTTWSFQDGGLYKNGTKVL